jgi:hypothetical protein
LLRLLLALLPGLLLRPNQQCRHPPRRQLHRLPNRPRIWPKNSNNEEAHRGTRGGIEGSPRIRNPFAESFGTCPGLRGPGSLRRHPMRPGSPITAPSAANRSSSRARPSSALFGCGLELAKRQRPHKRYILGLEILYAGDPSGHRLRLRLQPSDGPLDRWVKRAVSVAGSAARANRSGRRLPLRQRSRQADDPVRHVFGDHSTK